MDIATLEQRVEDLRKTPYDDRATKFADLFKDLLESHNISVREISHQTRISISFLEAFESGELGKLPGEVFGRGFLRNVSKLIGVDAQYLVDAFNACMDDSPTIGHTTDLNKDQSVVAPKAVQNSESKETVKTNKKVEAQVSSKANPDLQTTDSITTAKEVAPDTQGSSIESFKWLVPVFAAAAAITLVLWPTENEQYKQKNLPYAVKAMKNANVKAPNAVVNVPTNSTEVTMAAKTTDSVNGGVSAPANVGAISQHSVESHSFKSESAAFEQVVEIKVLEPVKIKKTIDSAKTVTEQLDPRTYTFRFDETAQFLIYDAGAVEVSFNGRAIGDLGKKGRVRRVSFSKKPENKATM